MNLECRIRGRRGLCFRVIVHLDLLEGPLGRDGRSPPPKDYKWHYGIIDGERTPRSRHDPRPVDRYDGRRREDDDDDLDQRGRRSHKDDSWSSRLFRSLSRTPRERERERSESHRGHRDRGSTSGPAACRVFDFVLQKFSPRSEMTKIREIRTKFRFCRSNRHIQIWPNFDRNHRIFLKISDKIPGEISFVQN